MAICISWTMDLLFVQAIVRVLPRASRWLQWRVSEQALGVLHKSSGLCCERKCRQPGRQCRGPGTQLLLAQLSKKSY